MNPTDVQAWISIISMLAGVGVNVGGSLKQLFGMFHVDHSLTEEQINAIEQAGIADDERRRAESVAMATPPSETSPS